MLLFVIVPLVEIFVIIQVGQVIGAWWTVLLLVVDSLLGAWLLKREGARTWRAFRQALQDGRWPGDEVAQGAMVIVGGTLLLTPGFVTDVVGFVLLIPVSRRILSRTVRSRVKQGVVGGTGVAGAAAAGAAGAASKRYRTRRRPDGTSGAYDVEVVGIYREDRVETPSRVNEIEARLVDDQVDEAEVVDDADADATAGGGDGRDPQGDADAAADGDDAATGGGDDDGRDPEDPRGAS